MNILIVCTGNICRSPMAEGLLRHRLAERGVQATVSSTGLAFSNRPATSDAVAALTAYGIDIGAHRSRILERQHVLDADLVLGMERSHVREVAVLVPEAFPRTFTVRELVRRAEASGPRAEGEAFSDWLRRVGAGRRPIDHLGRSAEDDVADPFQSSAKVYRRTAADLDDLLARLVAHGWPVRAEVAQP